MSNLDVVKRHAMWRYGEQLANCVRLWPSWQNPSNKTLFFDAKEIADYSGHGKIKRISINKAKNWGKQNKIFTETT